MQKQLLAKMQREIGRVRLRRRIRRNVGAISRSKVETSIMAEPVYTKPKKKTLNQLNLREP